MSRGRVLVAGIGNVFLGDDGFGVEVLRRLMQQPFPEEVELADFGIRGFDLAYALMDDYAAAILVDALPRGGPAGRVFVLEPDIDGIESAGSFDSHGMNPVEVFRMVKDLGGRPPKVLIVGCEPESFGDDNEGRMGLSPVVEAAVDEAVRLTEELVRQITQLQEVG